MTGSASPNLRHLAELCDHRGLFEHADGVLPREEDGYRTEDNARLLMVVSREPDADVARRLGRISLRFVLDAQDQNGQCRNRRDRMGRWTDVGADGDGWGRTVWALGTVAAQHDDPLVRRLARNGFDKSAKRRSRSARAMAFAALGAAAVHRVDATHGPSLSLLADALETIGALPLGAWAWPEARLSYANATLAEAVIAAGVALERRDALDGGLAMLGWLLARQTEHGHLSVSPTGGSGPEDGTGPRFDQRPEEVAALADACWRAFKVTGDRAWLRGVSSAAEWFTGSNDSGLAMFDQASGGGFDVLHAEEVDHNQGAAATLAFVSTMQRARALVASA